jgi:hypothetical protein
LSGLHVFVLATSPQRMALAQGNSSTGERVPLLGYLWRLLIATWRGYEANGTEFVANFARESAEALAYMKATGTGHALDDVCVYFSQLKSIAKEGIF